jgi:hypothetical protein
MDYDTFIASLVIGLVGLVIQGWLLWDTMRHVRLLWDTMRHVRISIAIDERNKIISERALALTAHLQPGCKSFLLKRKANPQ